MAKETVLYIHAIPCSDSNGKRPYSITPQQLANVVKEANICFKQAGIRLHFDPKEKWTWTPIKDTTLNNMKRSGNWTKKPNQIAAKYPGKIVIFFRWGEDKNQTGNGFAYPPKTGKPIPSSWKNEPTNVNFVALPNTKDLISGGFFSHELGHYLGLYHTFPGAGNGNVYPNRPEGLLKQVSVGSSSRIWGVNDKDEIYQRDGNGWQIVSGKLKHVSVGSDGTVWGVNASNNIYRRSGSGWTKISGKLKQISVGNKNHIWGVNAQNHIYRRTGNKWTKMPGKLKHVSAGKDGSVWGVNASNAIYRWNGSSWTKVAGALKQVSVGDANNIWGVNAKDDIYRRTGSKWTKVAGKLKYVSVAGTANIWGVNADSFIYRRDGVKWARIGGGHGIQRAKLLLHQYIQKNGKSAAAMNGDLITDTPRDPGTPIYSSHGWDRCKDVWRTVSLVHKGKSYQYKFKPQTRNVMSYFGCPMPQKFTKQQSERMHFTLKHASRRILIQPPCYPDFHGLRADRFQTCFDYWVNRGLWPVTLSATKIGSRLYMSGSFQKGKDRPVRHLITGAAYQKDFNTFKKKGFRPDRVTVARSSVGPRFTAIWTPIDGPFEARHGLTLPAFNQMWHSMRKKRYLNTDLFIYPYGSGLRAAAMWVKKSYKDYATYFGMTSAQYNSRFKDFWKKGLRVTCFVAYPTGSGYRFAAIWQKLPGSWAHYYGMTSSQYQKRYNEFAKKGLRLHQIQAYGNRYSAIWTKP